LQLSASEANVSRFLEAAFKSNSWPEAPCTDKYKILDYGGILSSRLQHFIKLVRNCYSSLAVALRRTFSFNSLQFNLLQFNSLQFNLLQNMLQDFHRPYRLSICPDMKYCNTSTMLECQTSYLDICSPISSAVPYDGLAIALKA
jgi:hypothetical protein